MVRLILLLMLTSCAVASTYEGAVSNAQRALMIQSGIQADLDRFNAFAMQQANEYGVGKPIGAGVFAYKVYRERSLRVPVSNRTSLVLKQDSVSFQWRF